MLPESGDSKWPYVVCIALVGIPLGMMIRAILVNGW